MISTLKKYVGDTLQFSKFQEREDRSEASPRKYLHEVEPNSPFSTEDQEDFLRDLRIAHDEWLRTQNLFDHAVDPELIDYMISMMDAAEKRYGYLLKQARKRGIHLKFE